MSKWRPSFIILSAMGADIGDEGYCQRAYLKYLLQLLRGRSASEFIEHPSRVTPDMRDIHALVEELKTGVNAIFTDMEEALLRHTGEPKHGE